MTPFEEGFMKAAGFNPIQKAKGYARWYKMRSNSLGHKAHKITGAALIGGGVLGATGYHFTKDPDMKYVPQGDYGAGNLGANY